MDEISNIKIHESDLREAIEWKIKHLLRQTNTETNPEIKAIHQKTLDRFKRAALTINQLDLIPQDKPKK